MRTIAYITERWPGLPFRLGGWLLLGPFMLLASGERLPAQPPDQPSSQADPAAPGASSVSLGDVRKLLRQLEADELQARDAAEKALIDMGPGIVPYLPQVSPSTSGELKVRLQRIRQALQQSKLETFFEASTVTLEGEFALQAALDEIQQQTGNVVRVQNEESVAGVRVHLDCQDEEFWTVLGSLMQQAQLRINAFGTTEPELVLLPGRPSGSVEPFVVGPFRVEATSIQARRLFASQLPGQLDFSFQLSWEPRLAPVFMQIPMQSVQAVVADGKQLAAANPQAAPEIPLNLGGCTTQVDLQLELPDRAAQRLESLAGELVIAVPGDRHQYVFKKFGNGARQFEKFGDVSVALEGARRNGAVYEMRVMVEFGDAQGALESFRGWILSNEAYLLDANDQRQENVGLQTYAIRPNAVGIAYLFQINGDPNDYRLVYESPAAITKQKIKYELNGIELP